MEERHNELFACLFSVQVVLKYLRPYFQVVIETVAYGWSCRKNILEVGVCKQCGCHENPLKREGEGKEGDWNLPLGNNTFAGQREELVKVVREHESQMRVGRPAQFLLVS